MWSQHPTPVSEAPKVRPGLLDDRPVAESLHCDWPDWYILLVKRFYPRPVFNAWFTSTTPERFSLDDALRIAFRPGPPSTIDYVH